MDVCRLRSGALREVGSPRIPSSHTWRHHFNSSRFLQQSTDMSTAMRENISSTIISTSWLYVVIAEQHFGKFR